MLLTVYSFVLLLALLLGLPFLAAAHGFERQVS